MARAGENAWSSSGRHRYDTVARGIGRGRRWCASARRANADAWWRIWNRLDEPCPDLENFPIIRAKAHAKTMTDKMMFMPRGSDLVDRAAKNAAAQVPPPGRRMLDWKQK